MFLRYWPFWSAGARQTAAAVVPGSQGQGAARTEPRLYTNIPPRLFARLLPVETQDAASPHAASPPPRPPQPATIIHTPPILEDTATVAYTRQRATLTLANMTIAVHVTDTSAPDELVYVFADHLGSASILADESGDPIPNSAARYLPFGDWRTEPTAAETSRWYTGHVHDNLSHNDLGLIYMNARFYLPGVARFLSADTLIPDPTNPQQFNRYTYSLNNPIRFTDPTGHCAENGDEACWSYLENQFCGDGLCEDWSEWVIVNSESIWVIDELIAIRQALLQTRGYFTSLGSGLKDWVNVQFSKGGTCPGSSVPACASAILNVYSDGSREYAKSIIVVQDVLTGIPDLTQRAYVLTHELGHAISNGVGSNWDSGSSRMGTSLSFYAEPMLQIGGGIPSAAVWSSYGGVNESEAWAEAFAARVYFSSTGNHIISSSVTQIQPGSDLWVTPVGGSLNIFYKDLLFPQLYDAVDRVLGLFSQ